MSYEYICLYEDSDFSEDFRTFITKPTREELARHCPPGATSARLYKAEEEYEIMHKVDLIERSPIE